MNSNHQSSSQLFSADFLRGSLTETFQRLNFIFFSNKKKLTIISRLRQAARVAEAEKLLEHVGLNVCDDHFILVL